MNLMANPNDPKYPECPECKSTNTKPDRDLPGGELTTVYYCEECDHMWEEEATGNG